MMCDTFAMFALLENYAVCVANSTKHSLLRTKQKPKPPTRQTGRARFDAHHQASFVGIASHRIIIGVGVGVGVGSVHRAPFRKNINCYAQRSFPSSQRRNRALVRHQLSHRTERFGCCTGTKPKQECVRRRDAACLHAVCFVSVVQCRSVYVCVAVC